MVSMSGYVLSPKRHINEAHSIHDSDGVGAKVVSCVTLTSKEAGTIIKATNTWLHKDLDEPTKVSGV